jgi:hypothetical protein
VLHCATRLLERIHSNLHKVPVPTVSGYHYWITFINNWLQYGWIWLFKKKSNAFEAFKAFKAHVKLQFGTKIACLHNNKGSEYIGHLWDTASGANTRWKACCNKAALQSAAIAHLKNTLLPC